MSRPALMTWRRVPVIVPVRVSRVATALPMAGDPAMPLSEPIDIVGDSGGAGLDAPVAIDGVSTPDAPRLRTNK